jgi:hypothetical protein
MYIYGFFAWCSKVSLKLVKVGRDSGFAAQPKVTNALTRKGARSPPPSHTDKPKNKNFSPPLRGGEVGSAWRRDDFFIQNRKLYLFLKAYTLTNSDKAQDYNFLAAPIFHHHSRSRIMSLKHSCT